MPLKLTRSSCSVKKVFKKRFKCKSKSNPYRHLTKTELIKKYEELVEVGQYYYGEFEALRTEYISIKDKYQQVKANNTELACKNAALLHENELYRSQLTKYAKDNLIKLSGAEKIYGSIKKEIIDLLSNSDPFFVLKQDFEKSLSVGDITHLESIQTARSNRERHLNDEERRQERVKEKIDNIFTERFDLSAMAEESQPSPISHNRSTFSVGSNHTYGGADSSSHMDFTTLLDKPTNSTMIETPSHNARIEPKSSHLSSSPDAISGTSSTPERNSNRESHSSLIETPSYIARIDPKTTHLSSTPSLTSDTSLTPERNSNWEYNSAFLKVTPGEPVLSTSLDSIQNFVPKTPLLTQPVANRSSMVESERRKSYFNRLSIAFPEKTPNHSPITSFNATRERASRRLINSTSMGNSTKNMSLNSSFLNASTVRISTNTTRSLNETNQTDYREMQNDYDSSEATSITGVNNINKNTYDNISEMGSNAQTHNSSGNETTSTSIISTTASSSNPRKTTTISSTRITNEMSKAEKNEDSNGKTSNGRNGNNSETDSYADNDLNPFRRSTRKRKRINYRELL